MFRIGFPLDAGENSHYIVVNLIRAKHHVCKDCGVSDSLPENSGSRFAWERELEFHSYYRFQFSIFPTEKRNQLKTPQQLFTEGNSDFAASALAIAQNSDLSESTPLVLVSCSCRPNPLEKGLHEVQLDKVTNENRERAKKSLLNKWRVATESPAVALVLHEKDVQILLEALQENQEQKEIKVFSLEEVNFSKLESKKTPIIVSCQDNDLPNLAKKLGISPDIFLPQKRAITAKILKIAAVIVLLLVGYSWINNVGVKLEFNVDVKLEFYKEDGRIILADSKVYSRMKYRIKLTVKKESYIYILQYSQTGLQSIYPTPDPEIKNNPKTNQYWYEFSNPCKPNSDGIWIPPRDKPLPAFDDKIGKEKFILLTSKKTLSNEELTEICKNYADSKLGTMYGEEKDYNVSITTFNHE